MHGTRVSEMSRTNAAEIRRLIDQAVDDLISAVEAGKSSKLKAYLAMVGRFHRYSLRNILLMASQRPDASFVAG